MKINDDIRKFLIRNSLITYSCVIITIVVVVFHFLTTQNAVDESRKYIYAINAEGAIVPLESMERRDNIEKELKHHLTMIVDNFYSLNQFNWEEKSINKAFNLADLEKIHKDRVNKNYYNRMIQFNVDQKAELKPENIEVKNMGGDNFEFRIIIELAEHYNQEIKNNYIIFAKGKSKLTDRNFPKNPHGIWVYEYVEERIEKLEKQ